MTALIPDLPAAAQAAMRSYRRHACYAALALSRPAMFPEIQYQAVLEHAYAARAALYEATALLREAGVA